MATKREKELLDISKAIYEHFTSDALQLAKRIVAVEKEIEEEEKNAPGAVTKPLLEVATPVAPVSTPIMDRPAPAPEATRAPVREPAKKDLPF